MDLSFSPNEKLVLGGHGWPTKASRAKDGAGCRHGSCRSLGEKLRFTYFREPEPEQMMLGQYGDDRVANTSDRIANMSDRVANMSDRLCPSLSMIHQSQYLGDSLIELRRNEAADFDVGIQHSC